MLHPRKIIALLFAFFVACDASSAAWAVSTGDCVAIEFTAEDCPNCSDMHRATDRAIEEGWAIRRIDTKRDPHKALQYRIQNVPTTILIRNGREVDRILGPIPFAELQRRLAAASSVDSMKDANERRRDPRNQSAHNDSGSESTAIVRGQSPLSIVPIAVPIANAFAMSRSGAGLNPSLSSRSVDASRNPSSDPEKATVRIRVEDAQHESVGTGTIIDSHQGEALVLTCGHLFRETAGPMKITVETFLGGQSQAYPATMIDFQAKEMDIGLIAFRPNMDVPVAKLIPKNKVLSERQQVFSWGCDRGAVPSRRDSQITKLNRYLGAPNVEVDGQPVEGRSGGGLFDERGELIGVCYAADPELKEGLYSAAEVVYHQLAKLGLQRLFNDRNDTSTLSRVPTNTIPNAISNASPRSMPELTVIMRDPAGQQEQLIIKQPTPELMQALREHTRR